MIEIQLTKGYVALIDDADAALAQYKWRANVNRRTVYAMRYVRRPDGSETAIGLHREVLGVTDRRVQVDHIDGNGLNCCRANLRIATGTENRRNRRPQKNRSGYKGVHGCDRVAHPWRARIRYEGRIRSLGSFASAKEAARAYDAAARDLFGRFARLNFPDGSEKRDA